MISSMSLVVQVTHALSELYEKHRERLEKAVDACQNRYAWTAYAESPSSRIHGKEIPAAAKTTYADLLDRPFDIELPGSRGSVGMEVSPFTGEPLGIGYPQVDVDITFAAAQAAMQGWNALTVDERFGLCLEMLDRLGQPEALFLNAHATMHTAGQSFIMAFAGCGANALDRGLEALAYARRAVCDVPATASWERRFGASEPVRLKKRYRMVPRGVAITVTCATFPQWNGYPAIMASLACGNPVIVKPHPRTILPVALFVRSMREVLAEHGQDPNLVLMVVDEADDPVTIKLLHHPDTAIIDFTGGPVFGRWIEDNCPNAAVYTETAGCNSVVIESTDNFRGMCDAIAHSLCQASAQMCTSVQNLFIPRDGIDTENGSVTYAEVCDALRESVERILGDTALTAFLCGAIVDEKTCDAVVAMTTRAQAGEAQIVRESRPYTHPDFDNARTATPLMLAVDVEQSEMYGQEHFGPISFMIACDDAEQGLQQATADVRSHGAITSHVYSRNEGFLDRAEDAYHAAGASLSCNLIGMPINFAAAYSDFHVTGLNPAGNACLTDLAFVTNRFRIVQTRFPDA